MKNLITRTITSLVAAAAVIVAMIWHPLALSALLLAAILTGLHELFRMAGLGGYAVQKWPVYLVSTIAFILPVLAATGMIPFIWLTALIPFYTLFFITELFRKKESALGNIALSTLAVLYLVVPFASVIFYYNPDLKGTDMRYHLLLGFMLLVSANDVFAYLVGMAVGRHKLFERISPKKTWEGSIGGLAATLVVAWILSLFIFDLEFMEWEGMAVIIVLFGTLGDLSESLLKRQFGVKDSGTLLPGHGGILDRFDAMMLSAPAVLSYLLILKA